MQFSYFLYDDINTQLEVRFQMRRVVCLLIIICLSVFQSIFSLANFYLKPIHSFTNTAIDFKVHNCMSGDFVYILNKQTVQKWDYKGKKIKTFKSSARNNLTVCFLIPQTQELVVAHEDYVNTSIVVWNETTAQQLRAIDDIPNEVVNMVYSPEHNQIILSTKKDGTIYLIDFHSLSIKEKYITNNNPNLTFVQRSMIYKRPNCPIALLLKRKDKSIIFNSNSRPLKYLNSLRIDTQQFKNTAFISPNCEQIFYIERPQQFENKTYYSTLNKRSKTTNFSEKWQKKIHILETVKSLNILDQKRQIFLFIEDAQHIVYDYQKDQTHFGPIDKSILNAQQQVRWAFIHENKKEVVTQRYNQTIVYKIQCKGLYYFNTDKTRCLPCQQNCLQCSQNYSLCSSCKQGYYISGIHCLKCLLPCETCEGQSRNCTSCSTNYIKQENKCVLDKGSISYASAVAVSVAGSFQTRVSMQIVSFFNQLWPYYYHKRSYSKKTIDFFEMVHTVQNNRWLFGGIDKQINFTFSHLNFSVYDSYSNQNLLEKQNKSSYFWDTTFQFFIYSVPITLTACLLLRLLFIALFDYQWSMYIRKYSFFIIFFVSVMDSNLIYIAFCTMNNFSVLFFFKFQDKLGQVIAILFTFALLFYSVAIFFLIKYLYQKLGKYFIEEYRFTTGSFAFCTINNIKAFTFGTIQALLYDQYEYQMWNFAALEVAMIIAAIIIQNSSKSFKQRSFLCILVLKQLIMVVLDILLWIDYKIQNMQYIDGLAEIFDSLILDTIYILTGIVILKIIATFLPSRFGKKKERNYGFDHQQKQGQFRNKIKDNNFVDVNNLEIFTHGQKSGFKKSNHNENIIIDRDKYSKISKKHNLEKPLKDLKYIKQKYRQENKLVNIQILDYIDQNDLLVASRLQFIVFIQEQNKPIKIKTCIKKHKVQNNIYIAN